MNARPSFSRAVEKPAPAVVMVHDDSGRLIGKIEGAPGSVLWKAWAWSEDRGEFTAIPGTYPGERAAAGAVRWRAGR